MTGETATPERRRPVVLARSLRGEHIGQTVLHSRHERTGWDAVTRTFEFEGLVPAEAEIVSIQHQQDGLVIVRVYRPGSAARDLRYEPTDQVVVYPFES